MRGKVCSVTRLKYTTQSMNKPLASKCIKLCLFSRKKCTTQSTQYLCQKYVATAIRHVMKMIFRKNPLDKFGIVSNFCHADLIIYNNITYRAIFLGANLIFFVLCIFLHTGLTLRQVKPTMGLSMMNSMPHDPCKRILDLVELLSDWLPP